MKRRRPTFAIRVWRRIAPTNTARALALCLVFASLIALGIYRGWHPWSAAPLKPATSFAALEPGNPVDLFLETRIGAMLFWPEAGDNCRRVTFDNRTGILREAGYIPCVQAQPQAEPPKTLDRLTALRKTFQK